MAIRMALGASRGELMSQVLGRGLGLAGVGVALGGVLAWWTGRLLEGNLYGVTARDPATFATAVVVVVIVTLVASYLPARRASRVDPLATLRCE